MLNNPDLQDLFVRNAESVVGTGGVRVSDPSECRGGSTDMGDLSNVMPVYHPNVRAAEGTGHGNDYVITDWDLGILTAAKAMAFTVIDLLADGAEGANRVVAESKPPLTKDSYLSLMRSYMGEEVYAPEVV